MLFGIIVIWMLTAIGLIIVSLTVPGIRAKTTGDLLLAALILGIINAFIRPLLWILTWPLTVLSFGIFALLINAFMIQLTAELVPGFEVRDFASALLGAVIMVLLAIAGFILVEWFLFNGVFWLHMNAGRSILQI
ncbi:phage holin family protein [Thiolapillus sp.]